MSKFGFTPGNETSAAIGGQNVTIDPVEKLCFAGVQTHMTKVFNAPTIWTAASDKVKALERLYGTSGVSYPYIFLNLSSVTQAQDKGSLTGMRNFGSKVVLSTDQKRFYKAAVTPVDLSVSVEFVTNSYEQTLSFMNSWMFARIGGWVAFEVEYGGTSFGVRAVLGESVSFPTREAGTSNVQEYVGTADMTVHMHFSYPVLQNSQVMDTIVASTDTATAEEVSSGTLERGTSGKTVVWEYTRKVG